jgi:DNA-binding transcriptional regulator PaaX
VNRKRSGGKINIQKILLGTISMAGLLSVALIAPNALHTLEKIKKFQKSQQRNRYKYYLNEAAVRMEKKGLLRREAKGGRIFYALTERGQLELLRYRILEDKKERKKWDGKWRVVIFGIKELRRSTRNRIRESLIAFGFMKLQNSVWITPYECEEIV